MICISQHIVLEIFFMFLVIKITEIYTFMRWANIIASKLTIVYEMCGHIVLARINLKKYIYILYVCMYRYV